VSTSINQNIVTSTQVGAFFKLKYVSNNI